MWQYNISEKRLINKVYGFQNKRWLIPQDEGREGSLERENSSKVYGLGQKTDCSYGRKLKSQSRGWKRKGCETAKNSQIWLRNKDYENGWFTIENHASGLLLTAKDQNTYEVTGKCLLSYLTAAISQLILFTYFSFIFFIS